MNRWLSICLVICCLACTRPPGTITRGFYYWKQRYAPDTATLHTLEALRTRRLYVKLFDVALAADKQTVAPVARLDQRSAFPAGMEIITIPPFIRTGCRNADTCAILLKNNDPAIYLYVPKPVACKAKPS